MLVLVRLTLMGVLGLILVVGVLTLRWLLVLLTALYLLVAPLVLAGDGGGIVIIYAARVLRVVLVT